MKNFSRFLYIILIIIFAGGGLFLSTWEIPAPTQIIKKELPDDRFPR